MRVMIASEPDEADRRCKTRRPFHEALGRAARALCLSMIVATALLTFPSATAWMVAFWLAWYTVAVARGRSAWLPLVACLGVLVAKRLYWTPTLVALASFILIVALVEVVHARKRNPPSQVAWITALALWATWALFALDWRASASCNHAVELKKDRPIVCLGDSVTSGLLPDKGYPDVMADMLAVPVVNLGQSGLTADVALDMLPRVKEANPQIVVLEIGGHDYMRGEGRAATKQNIERLITSCREMGAEVVLVAIPRGFMTDPFWGLERELARKYDLQLVSDGVIRRFVLWSPISLPGAWFPNQHLSDDGIHPNKRGTRLLAETVANSLVQMYGQEIREVSKP